MADQIRSQRPPDSRSAARLAALVAVPVALLTGVGLFLLLTSAADDRDPDPAPSASAPPPAGPPAAPPVAAPARELTEWEEIVCRALLSQLPGELDGLAQRPVTARPEQNAAYGDPPVLLACGVPAAEYELTDPVYPLPPGVCWHLVEEPDESVWTTLDREVPVRVSVPAGYDGPGQLVTVLSGPVAQFVRSADTVPAGC